MNRKKFVKDAIVERRSKHLPSGSPFVSSRDQKSSTQPRNQNVIFPTFRYQGIAFQNNLEHVIFLQKNFTLAASGLVAINVGVGPIQNFMKLPPCFL